MGEGFGHTHEAAAPKKPKRPSKGLGTLQQLLPEVEEFDLSDLFWDVEQDHRNYEDKWPSPTGYPEWTDQGINHLGDGIFETQDGETFFSEKDALEYVSQNYWDPNVVDIPQSISDLENTSVLNYGFFPTYLQKRSIDPLDSTTWDIPQNTSIVDRKEYVQPDEANEYFAHPANKEQFIDWVNDKWSDQPDIAQQVLDEDLPRLFKDSDMTNVWRQGNLIDYYAGLGNPELKRGSTTGFWPKKYYPEGGLDALRDYVDRGKLIKRYTDQDSLGWYNSGDHEIALDWYDMMDQNKVEDLLLNTDTEEYDKLSIGERQAKVLNRDLMNEVLAHEGFHYNMYDHVVGDKALENELPYPRNVNYQNKWQKATAHPAMHYIDNMFFPETRAFNLWNDSDKTSVGTVEHNSPVNISEQGMHNVNALMNWSSPSDWSGSGSYISEDINPTWDQNSSSGTSYSGNPIQTSYSGNPHLDY